MKVTKKKGDKLYVKWKGYDKSLITAQTNKTSLYEMSYYQKRVIVSYVTKSSLKVERCIHAQEHAKKADLASLKSNVNKLNINKLNTKLSNVEDYDAFKTTVYDELVTKVNAIENSKLVEKVEDKVLK